MISLSPKVAISEAQEGVAEALGAKEPVVRAAKEGLWPALRRRAGEFFARWMERQAILSLYGFDQGDS